MAGGKWTKVARAAKLQDGVPVSVTVGRREVLLVRIDGEVYACGNQCTHYGAPLSDGVLLGKEITCPWHTARFDVTTGKMAAPPALDPVPCYEVKTERGQVYVRKGQPAPFPKPTAKDGRTFVILGGGAAGNAAAETLRREGFAGRVVMITQEKDLPYDRTSLSKAFLAGATEAESLTLRDADFYEEIGIELLTGRRVVAVDPAGRAVAFARGKPLAFDALLLATGSTPRNLDIPGTGLKGYFLLRSLAGAKALVAAAEKASRAVILGASFVGLEAASSLRARGIEVHVAAPEPVPMIAVFGERIGRVLQKKHEEQGVVFHLGQTAREIIGAKRVKAVKLGDGTVLDADLVLAGVGVTPAVGYLEGTGLAVKGAVPVTPRLETSVRGIFAAGDIAAVPDPHTGERRRTEHWVVAERQGQHAARAMLGSDKPYDEVPFFWTRQHDTSLKYLGYAKTWDRIAYRGDVEGGEFVAGYYQSDVLRAVAAVGMARESIILGEVLKRGTPIAPEQLENEGVHLARFLERKLVVAPAPST